MKQNKYEIDMCNGTIMDKLISFSLPLMLSGILQLMFNAVDIIVVGRFSGSQALAAVGSTTALINVFYQSVYWYLTWCECTCCPVLCGRKRPGNVRYRSYGCNSCTGKRYRHGICGTDFFQMGSGTDGYPGRCDRTVCTVYENLFSGYAVFMLYNYGAAILRAVGDTKRPLIFLVISGVVNAVLNLILVIMFHMDVAGVAIATVISQLISCILVLRCLRTSKTSYQLHFGKLRINTVYLKQIFQVGIPAGIQSTVINLSNALLQSSVNSFGSTAMAGYTAANNIFGFLYVAVNSVTQACMSFTSQNYGVHKFKRMDKVLVDCLIISVVTSFSLGCGAYFFGSEILKIYTADPEVIRCGLEILSYTTVPYFLCGIMDLFPGALRGMGHSGVPMILSVIGTVGTRIVWIFGIFPHHRSLAVLFISYPASWMLTIIMQVTCFYLSEEKCIEYRSLSFCENNYRQNITGGYFL